jgi:hypothetical protein
MRAMTLAPEADVLIEAQRIASAAREQSVSLWLVGGTAIQLHCQVAGAAEALVRIPVDIDVATAKGGARAMSRFFEQLGYRDNKQFNALNGKRRLLFYDDAHGRQVDVFIGGFEMCHSLPIVQRVAGRADAGPLPAAELLLMKLQIVQLTPKDLQDVLHLFHSLDVGDSDDLAINGRVVAELCAQDWGLWRTCQLNLDRTLEAIPAAPVSEARRTVIAHRVSELRRYIDDAPKTRRWRMRARVGERVRWYEEPEEVGEEIPLWDPSKHIQEAGT